MATTQDIEVIEDHKPNLSARDLAMAGIGGLKVLNAISTMGRLTMGRALKEIKDSKSYKDTDCPSWETFCGTYLDISYKTANRCIEEVEDLTVEFLDRVSVLSISDNALRKIRLLPPEMRPTLEGGYLEIPFEKEPQRIPIGKENAPAAQAAINQLLKDHKEKEKKLKQEKRRFERESNSSNATIIKQEKEIDELKAKLGDLSEVEIVEEIKNSVDLILTGINKLNSVEIEEVIEEPEASGEMSKAIQTLKSALNRTEKRYHEAIANSEI